MRNFCSYLAPLFYVDLFVSLFSQILAGLSLAQMIVNEGIQHGKQEGIEVLLFLCQILLKKKNSTIQKITV